jgi:hypothetical protein
LYAVRSREMADFLADDASTSAHDPAYVG